MNPRITLPALLLTSLVTACGGGSPATAPESSQATPEPAAGQTETSPTAKGRIPGIQGLRYESGSQSGQVDEDGFFNYENGQRVHFFVGDIEVGSAPGQAALTLADLAGGDSGTEDNLTRFLLSLDYDQAPMNGILIVNDMHEAARGQTLDFNQSAAAFKAAAEALLQAELASDLHLHALRHSLTHLLPGIYAQRAAREARMLTPFSYPKTSAGLKSQFPDIENEAAAVFGLMLGNTVRENSSPLEYIFKATNTRLVLEGEGSLVDLYVQYKDRVERIGRDAAYVERTDLTTAPDGSPTTKPIHHFAVMSDFQMRDDESPLNVNPVKFLISSSYYPASAHIPYQVDDMVRTLRQYESQQPRPIEMAIFTGDFADISQYNEVRLGLDVLDGGLVNPDTGIDDDPISGQFADGKPNDTYDPFTALGLNGSSGQADIPWYYVAGNHDGLMLGNFPVTDSPMDRFGRAIRGGTRAFFDGISTGDRNWLGYDPSLLGFLQHLFDPDSFYVPPDTNRKVLNPGDIADEMFRSSSQPQGHGMQLVLDEKGHLNGRLHYSFDSANGLVKHIALDTNMPFGPEGWLDLYDLAWVKEQLQAAESAGQLVIVSSHHKPKDIVLNGALLVKTLNESPNVIAHLVAHSHINRIAPRPGADAAHGYWEIESGSMVNWPQQFRILDIHVDQASGKGYIKSTMLNHATDSPLHVAQRGRFLAYLERYLEGFPQSEAALAEAEGDADERNTYLYFVVPDAVLARL